MGTDNKSNSKKTETAVAASAVGFPVLRNGRYVCSDGQQFTDSYFAETHEKQLKKQQLCQKQN